MSKSQPREGRLQFGLLMAVDRFTQRSETCRGSPPGADTAATVRYKVSDLMRGGREAVLEHDGADYLLRITANGRLILTK